MIFQGAGTSMDTEEKTYTKEERVLGSPIICDLLNAISVSCDYSEATVPVLFKQLRAWPGLDDFLRALAVRLNKLPELEWRLVSYESQQYHNVLANAINENQDSLPLPPDLPTEEGLIEDPNPLEEEGEQGKKRMLRGWAARPPSHTERVRKVIVTYPHLSIDELTAKIESMGLHISHSSIRAIYYHCYRTVAVLAEEGLLDPEYAKNFNME